MILSPAINTIRIVISIACRISLKLQDNSKVVSSYRVRNYLIFDCRFLKTFTDPSYSVKLNLGMILSFYMPRGCVGRF